MQTRRHVSRLRGWPAVIGGGIAARGVRAREDHALRAGNHVQTRMHHHRVPERVLLHGQHRGSKGKNAVIICFINFSAPFTFNCAIHFIFLFASRAFANQIERPFGIRYNPYTQSVEVLTDAQKITAVVSELRGDLCIVSNALKKIHEQDDTVDVERITNMLTHGIEIPQDTSSSDSDNQDDSPNTDEPRTQDNADQSRCDSEDVIALEN